MQLGLVQGGQKYHKSNVNNKNKLSMRMGMVGGSREIFNFCLESRGSCHCICYHLVEKKKMKKRIRRAILIETKPIWRDHQQQPSDLCSSLWLNYLDHNQGCVVSYCPSDPQFSYPLSTTKTTTTKTKGL